MFRRVLMLAAALALGSSHARAGLVDTRVDTTPGGAIVDGVLSPDEYGPGNSYTYGGAGTGFGGTLGNGTIYFNSDATNLYLGVQVGGDLNDLIFIQFDSKAGGQTDATMDDQGDGGRRAASQQANAADDAYPAGFLADYSIVVGNFGIVTFGLNAGNTPFHLDFVDFNGTFSGNGTGFREYSIPLASLGITDAFNFFAGYTSDSGYLSNESIPANPNLQNNGNPGFGDGQFGGTVGSPGYDSYNRFVVVPEPATLTLLAFGAISLIRRRR